MSDSAKKFERFREEHARLHDPALLRGAVALVPTSWNDAMSDWSKKSKTGKKKLWRELKHAAEQSTAETFLPAEFIEALRSKAEGQQAREPAVSQDSAVAAVIDAAKKAYLEKKQKAKMLGGGEATDATPWQPAVAAREKKETQGSPAITIEPANLTVSLDLFQEQAFALDAPLAQRVELVWLTEQSPNLHRVVMDHQHHHHFDTRVGFPDGSYLVSFAVDDYMLPDPRLAHSIVLNQQGLFARLRLRREKQTFVLTNRSTGHERLLMEAGAEWLLPQTASVDVVAGESVAISTRFDVAAMKPGSNETLLRFSVERAEGTLPAGVVHIAVQVEAGGAVPDILFEPHEFGDVMQGMDELQLLVEVRALGRGPLTGMISLPHSGELADFELDADSEVAARYDHIFQIDTAQMSLPQPNRVEATLRVRILTDSFLSNHRLREFEIPYRLVYLKKSLPALSFGNLRVDATKTMRLEVTRSDKQDIDLSVQLPPGAERYLEAYLARAGTYVFRFDAGALPPGSSISETIKLTDKRSGLQSQIKVLANVASAAAEQTHAVAN
jgi:hypothetical protein